MYGFTLDSGDCLLLARVANGFTLRRIGAPGSDMMARNPDGSVLQWSSSPLEVATSPAQLLGLVERWGRTQAVEQTPTLAPVRD
jgi:hypothetical protein